MATYTFTKEQFPNLAFEEYLGTWTSLGLDELQGEEQTIMMLLLGNLGDIESMNTSNILLVKAAEGGILKDVYGPSIFRNGSNLVLKVGNLEFPIDQEKMTLRVGQLEGTLSFEDRPMKIRLKDSSGEEYDAELYNATCDLMPTDGTELEFRVRCSWDPESSPQPGTIKAAMRRGESIAKFFRSVPQKGEGGHTLKMQELGEGEFKVSGIRKLTGGTYGDSYVLELADGRSVWARGTVSEILKTGWKMPTTGSVTLQVANIRERSEGKFALDCALRLREPRGSGEPQTVVSVKKPNVLPPADYARQFVAANNTDVIDVQYNNVVDVESLPF